MSELSARLAGLSPEKRELLEALLRKKKAEAASAAVIPPRGAVSGPFPLSFSQERLWLLDQLEPGSPAYNIPIALRLAGDLDVRALRGSYAALVRRHESLRTRFAVRDGNPVQAVDPPGLPPLPLADLGGLPAGVREAEARERAEAEGLRPFDLQDGPLCRCVLFRLAGGDHLLLANLHHIVSDGWSTGIFARELGAFYTASRSDRPAALPPLPIQYADFALWQRKELSGATLEKHLTFWRQRLAGLEPVLELPSDRPRPAQRSPQGASFPLALPEPLSRDLKELALRQGTTLFTTLLAALFALLYRQTDQEDLCVGTPVAGRRQVETEGLIGFFVNTLVVSAGLAGAPSFRDHLARVHEAVLDAQGHEALPFEKLVSELAPERSLSHNPVFQVAFTFQNAPGQALELPGVAVRGVDLPLRTAKFDLTLALGEGSGRIAGGLDYSLDLFDAPTIARTAGQLQALLTAVAANPEVPLSEIPLLAPPERHQLLVEWNDTSRPYLPGVCLHELIQAERMPDAVAASFEDQALSYRELDRRANRLAHRLIGLGIKPDDRVGVRLERSLEMIIALLGVLKAGAAYVPLEPTYPAERLALLVASSGIEVVLDRRLPGTEPDTAPAVHVEQDHLAYVIYTSGSTGTPKGVMVPHRGIVNRLLWMQEAYPLAPGDRVLQKTPFSFDVSLGELFGPLLAGARLVFARPEGHKDPAYLAELIAREGITSLHFVPSMLGAFLEVGADLSSVRRVLASGEALPLELVRRFFEKVPGVELLNLYGPTEASVEVSVWACDPERLAVPIGRPISNLRLHVVNRELRPQPAGIPGELLLGGVGLARGYLGRPDLTAAAFVPDPFAEGGRLYRTGDLCRLLPDGNVEFLGRIDHQVKVRGFRIELGEIETVLGQHPGVARAVVVVLEERLVAYLVLRAGDAPRGVSTLEGVDAVETPRGASPHLRAFLLRSLPEYMVPAAFVALPAFPLTPSGKVDRRALPTPERDPRAVSVAPRTRTEEALAEIWKELLGLEQVSVGDSFFELGGHSLLAFQVVGRVREALGVEIALREIFEAPAIAGLAARIDARSAPAAPGIARVPRDGDLPLSFAQQRLWFLDQLDPGTPAYNIPLAVRVTGALSVGLLEWIFAEVVRRHEALRTLFAGPMQVVAPPWSPRLPVIDLSGLPDREALVHGLAREEAARPFDLARGPLLRLSLLRLGERDHLLLMTMHHIVSDGWSMGVLLREIAALYEGSPLPELTLQYADFAVWQRDWLRGEILETQLSYWRRQLAGAPKVLELPWDRPRPPLQTSRGASRSVALSSRLSEALQGLCRRVRVTPFMALLAGWALLLGRHAGQEDMLLGTPTAGRSRRELEGLIGVFVNTLVLRTDLAGPPDFAALLDQARQTALDAYTHQDLPFERLVEELVPERDLSHSPLFQAMLVLQNTPGGGLSLPGLTLTPLDTDSGTAQLDLTLVLQERRDGVFHGALEHNTDLFDGSTAARLWDRFTALLEAAVASPALPLSELPLLPAAERHQALVEWNDTAWAYRFELGLHEQVARQAESRPDAVAVSFEGQALSYRELDRRANRLAHRLIGLGVEPEARVAVLAERSPELIVALLGILKAGGVYVPLDPAYPRERLDFMREDSGAAVLLPLDEDLEGESGEAPLLKIEAEQIAYVLYTSGSTGRPKGVMVPHGALVRYVEAVRPVYGIGPGDRVLQFCSVSFDTSLEEILPCLAGGAELVLRTDAMLESPAVFLESCGARGITALSLPTAYWHEIAAKNLPLPPHLRLVILGGERALLERVESWRQHTQGRPRLVNSYGVTEATIVSTAVDLEARSAAEGRGEVSIGRVLRGTEAFLLDREGQPVPPGALGELHLGGGLLARGYLGRPDLTAERFVPHPFAAEPGGRLYRTGDLARALADGALEFAGRADRQIKVRGYRIEIEEIEARLLCHPEVEAAVVAAREDPAGEKRIVAYVVPHSLPGPAPAALRAFVREALPDYMVPGAYVELAALPLSPNGKVDRRAVSASAAPERASFGEGAAAPSDPVEELLAGIWSEVLGLERVGAHDDFFALGGHSLLATQVVSRIRTVLGIELPLRRLFETPTLVELAQAVRKSRESQAPPIVAVPRDGDLPLSFAQQRLWFLDRLEPGSPAYNMPLAVRLAGEVDPAQLEDIFFEVVRRHEALRTTFASRDGMPIQVIAAPRVELPVLDLSLVPESEALRLAREEAGRPFDLERGPLLRLALIRLGERDHVLLMTLHHIISDGWSMGVLLREVAALCEDSPLPELPVQYADFAVWQRSWLRGEVLEAQLAYWRRQLGNLNGAPRVLELPLDRPRPAVQTFRGASLRVALTAEAIHAICRREGATPFMVLLAAWAAVLGRHAGQEDVLVGTPIAGRNRREVEGLIGFFVNTLALRADLSGDPGFTGLLGRMRRTALDGYAHQDVPFERLVEELVPERDMAHSPLFQVLLALQNAPGETLSLEGLDLTPLDVADTVAKFDLTLSFAERQGFEGALEYNTDLFDGSTVMRLWARFTVLLEAALAAPDRPLSELPLLRPEERHQAFLEWNDTARSFPGGCLHELVTRQAERTPDAVAASFEGQQLSYGELERRANRLAHRLTGKPDVRIGVMLERSLEMIVALLGVLKAGAAYIPLDPSHPAERLALLLESSGARVVLSQEHLLVLDGPDTPPAVPLGEDNLAYVIYTSGSTGTPKGVMVPHRGIVNRLLWMQEAYPLTPGDRVLQKTPFTFDVSLGELFGPLLCGARLVFARPEGHRDPAYLADLIAHEGITALHFVPSMLGAFLEVEADLASVRRVLASGEALPPELVRRFSRATDAELLNLYGPTEASVEVSVWPCDPERPTVAIGRPISNLRLYVLQPVGVPGELLLGGVGLARGYLGRPDLTAAAFVPDPFGNGERLYRTGDFCRLLPDGNVEFLGRIDHQVKIRGFRIELGEVEAALLRHPQVRECAVVVREETLAAYVVGTAEPGVLRTFLDERLPGYMVPAVFVTLGALPLTSSGKVDRASLPTPERTHQALAPRDVLELRLVRLWEELLGLEPIGVQDDFFELGGHSLLAVQLVARIQKSFGKALPLAAVLRNPTVERLAAVLREGEVSQGVLVELAPGTGRPFFCVHAVGGEVLSYVHLARLLDRPVYGLQAQGDATVEDMAARYIQAVREVQPQGPYTLGGWSMGGVVAFEMARQLEQQGEAVDQVVLIDSQAPGQVEGTVPDGELAGLFAYDVARVFGIDELDLPPEEMERRFALFQTNFRALERYAGGPCAAPGVLFRTAGNASGPGWKRFFQQSIEIYELPGDHYTLLQLPHVQRLAALLGDIIESPEEQKRTMEWS